MGEVVKIKQSSSVSHPIPPSRIDDTAKDATIKKKGSNGDGGGNMEDKYATKQELKTLETKIEGRFNVLDEKFNTIDQKLENINTNMNIKHENITTNMDSKFESINANLDAKLERQTNTQIRWFIGTAIAIAGLVWAIVSHYI